VSTGRDELTRRNRASSWLAWRETDEPGAWLNPGSLLGAWSPTPHGLHHGDPCGTGHRGLASLVQVWARSAENRSRWTINDVLAIGMGWSCGIRCQDIRFRISDGLAKRVASLIHLETWEII
jgi:hypothetical protein